MLWRKKLFFQFFPSVFPFRFTFPPPSISSFLPQFQFRLAAKKACETYCLGPGTRGTRNIGVRNPDLVSRPRAHETHMVSFTETALSRRATPAEGKEGREGGRGGGQLITRNTYYFTWYRIECTLQGSMGRQCYLVSG